MSQSTLSRPTTTARHQRIGPLRPQYAQEMLLSVQTIRSVLAVRPGAHLPCRSGIFERRARSSTEQEIRGDLSGLAEPISASVETGALDNQCLQGGRVDGVTLVEIDGTYRLAVQTRVEEPFRILQLGTLWKRQPHRVLEGLAYADDTVVGPDGHPLGPGGLLPLHLFDQARVGTPDQSPQLAQPLTPPAGHPADDVIYLLGRGCVAHADALLRLLSTQRTEGLSSLSFRCVQPSQQHGRRFPSSSSDRTLWICWLLVSAFFGQSTQQIHSLRTRGVRSCHAARTFGLAIRTRLKSTGTVCATPPETTLELIDRPS